MKAEYAFFALLIFGAVMVAKYLIDMRERRHRAQTVEKFERHDLALDIEARMREHCAWLVAALAEEAAYMDRAGVRMTPRRAFVNPVFNDEARRISGEPVTRLLGFDILHDSAVPIGKVRVFGNGYASGPMREWSKNDWPEGLR